MGHILDDIDDDFSLDDDIDEATEESPESGDGYCVWLELTPLGGVRRICLGREAPAEGVEVMGEFPDINKAQEFATNLRTRYPLGIEGEQPGLR